MQLLPVSKFLLSSQRCRATYFQQGKRFPPAFVRRFMLRYPNSHLYFVLALCCGAMVGPVIHQSYYFLTLSKEEFADYAKEKNAVVLNRQKFGKDLWFPFLSKTKTETETVAN